MSTKKLVPPKKYVKDFYDYNEVSNYLERLHKKNFRNYKNKKYGTNDKTEYCDFWHFITDCNEVTNGGFLRLPEISDSNTDWQNEILGFFDEFLGDFYYDDMYVIW